MNTLPDLSQLTHEQLLEFTRQLALQHQSLAQSKQELEKSNQQLDAKVQHLEACNQHLSILNQKYEHELALFKLKDNLDWRRAHRLGRFDNTFIHFE
jgi:transposase